MKAFAVSSIVSFVLSVALSAHAAVPTALKAKVYDLDKKDILYTYDHKTEGEGTHKTINNVYAGTDGNPVVVEKAVVDGTKPVSYEVSQKQLKTEGKIEVNGDKVLFSYTKDGKTKTSNENLKSNFVIGPTLVPYMRANWEALMNGKEVDIRFGVVDRLETVGFTFKKIEEKDYNGQKAVVIRMKPSSFLIAALVKPLMFTLSRDNERLLEIRGRTLPKMKSGDAFKNLDATIVYQY
jgi:hypothetical protein